MSSVKISCDFIERLTSYTGPKGGRFLLPHPVCEYESDYSGADVAGGECLIFTIFTLNEVGKISIFTRSFEYDVLMSKGVGDNFKRPVQILKSTS